MVMIQREMVAHSWTMITMNAVEHSRAVHAGGQGWSASGSSAGQPDRAAGPRTSWARSLWAPEAFSCGRDIKPRADGKCGAGAGGVVEERSLSQNSGSTASDVGLLGKFEDAGPCEMAEYPNVPRPDAQSRDYEKTTTPFCISQGCCDRCSEAEVSPVCSSAAGSGAVGVGAVGSSAASVVGGGELSSGTAGSRTVGCGAADSGAVYSEAVSDAAQSSKRAARERQGSDGIAPGLAAAGQTAAWSGAAGLTCTALTTAWAAAAGLTAAGMPAAWMPAARLAAAGMAAAGLMIIWCRRRRPEGSSGLWAGAVRGNNTGRRRQLFAAQRKLQPAAQKKRRLTTQREQLTSTQGQHRRSRCVGHSFCAQAVVVDHDGSERILRSGDSDSDSDIKIRRDVEPILAPGAASGYKGVSYDSGRRAYRAVAIDKGRKRVRLGDFPTALEAAMCYTRYV